MKKLVGVVTLFALGTACPKVEKKTYRFDVKQGTGSLTFHNVYSDSPEKSDQDFMELVNNVLNGSSVEDDHPGWKVSEKKFFANEDKLDGLVSFSFEDVSSAGLFKHDKKSPYVWCASRDEEQTVTETNGKQIAELPGCVVWERKANDLWVTVKLAEPEDSDKTLLDSWQRWSAGEKLNVGDGGIPGLGDFGADPAALEDMAAGLLGGLADNLIQGEVSIDDPVVTGADAALASGVASPLIHTQLKMCAVQTETPSQAFEDVATFTVAPDGTYALEISQSTEPWASRLECVREAFQNVTFPAHASAWSARVTIRSLGASVLTEEPTQTTP